LSVWGGEPFAAQDLRELVAVAPRDSGRRQQFPSQQARVQLGNARADFDLAQEAAHQGVAKTLARRRRKARASLGDIIEGWRSLALGSHCCSLRRGSCCSLIAKMLACQLERAAFQPEVVLLFQAGGHPSLPEVITPFQSRGHHSLPENLLPWSPGGGFVRPRRTLFFPTRFIATVSIRTLFAIFITSDGDKRSFSLRPAGFSHFAGRQWSHSCRQWSYSGRQWSWFFRVWPPMVALTVRFWPPMVALRWFRPSTQSA